MQVLASIDISESLQRGFDSFFGFIPNLIGFLVILLVGYVIARIVRNAVTRGWRRSASTGPCMSRMRGSTRRK